MVPLKYLSNIWTTLEMRLINCEVELILTWSAGCFIIDTDVTNQVPTFTITETNLYVPAVTLSTQDNAKLLQQLKSGFKRRMFLFQRLKMMRKEQVIKDFVFPIQK